MNTNHPLKDCKAKYVSLSQSWKSSDPCAQRFSSNEENETLAMFTTPKCYMNREFITGFLRTSSGGYCESQYSSRPSDRVRKKWKIMRKKVTIMRIRRQIMRKFLKLIKLFPWLFQGYKILVNVLPRINSFMTCLTFCCHSWTAISLFNAVFLYIFLSEAQ